MIYEESDAQRVRQLQKLWDELPDRIIQGSKISQYKINKNQFLGRGGFGIVYGGIRKTPLPNPTNIAPFEEVAIKEFKKSQKWRHEEDQDKQYGGMLKTEYVLQVVEVFQERDTQRYFLITPLARGGNLCERMRGSVSEQDVFQFALRLAEILKYIHYDALTNFRSKQIGEEQKQRVAIIHRDVKPQNIVFLTRDQKQNKDMKTLYLLDFGIAKIGYSQFLKGYNNCGTSYYKAPQIGEGRIYNAKVDIYSYGCTLYEMINDGQKLITTAGISTRYGDRERFIKSKLIDLHLKLLKSKKFTAPGYWVFLLNNCLAYDIKKRYSSEDLLDFLAHNSYGRKPGEDKAPFYGTLPDKQLQAKGKREIFQINFQIFRLSVIQDVIFAIFEYVYFEQPRISKFTLYAMLKFIVHFFAERFARLKERCKLVDKKYQQLRGAIEEKKVLELKEKSHNKMEKEIVRERSNDLMQNKKNIGPNQDIVRRFPELMNRETSEPKRVLYEFCYQKKAQLLENEKFAKFILTIISYMEDFDYYEQLKVESSDLDNLDVEVLSVKRMHLLKKAVDERLSKDGLKSKLESCRVEGSLKSNINKEENKTDLDIERSI